jgi:ferredoxin
MVKIDEDKCIGCGACESVCLQGFQVIDGKAKIKNPKADCIKEAISACPRGAILMDDEEFKDNRNSSIDYQNNLIDQSTEQGRGLGMGRGQGFGQGRGRGMGQGRGLGLGPRNGRGRGRRG